MDVIGHSPPQRRRAARSRSDGPSGADLADCSNHIARAQTPCNAAAEQHYARQTHGTKRPFNLSLKNWEVPMTSLASKSACAFAWRNYLLRHNSISEDDNRRSALHRYVSDLRDTRGYDFDLLQIAAVAYLKHLDKLHDDREARLAADQALAQCLKSRSAQLDTRLYASLTPERRSEQHSRQDRYR